MPDQGIVAAMTGVLKPFSLREFPVSQAAPGAVVVKVNRANVCGSDLHLWKGEYVPPDSGSVTLRSMGHEMCGQVHELGEGVSSDAAGQPLKVGDRIVYRYMVACGHCRTCMRGTSSRCAFGLRHRKPPTEWPHFNGAYGQYYYAHPGQVLFKVPDNVSDDLASPANCAWAQAVYSLRQAGAGIGDHVVVQGAGGVGIAAVAIARWMGAASVTVIDAMEERLAVAKAFGAENLLNIQQFPTPNDRVQAVKKLTDGWGADVVLELTGKPQAVPEGLEMVGFGGTYVVVGCICAGHTCTFDPAALVLTGKRMLGLFWYDPASLKIALEFLSTHATKFPFEKLSANKYSLKEIDQAFADQNAGKIHRATLMPWD